MRKFFIPSLLLGLLFCFSAAAQKIPKPTLTPAELTPAQRQLIQEGIRLHDQKRFAEAVEKYDQVLRENPTSVGAIYEKAMSLYHLKNYQQSLDLAFEGLKYKSNDVALFYTLIANIYDDQGKPDKAVELYQEGIKILEGDPALAHYLASVYFNLGVTNVRQKKMKDARENLKKAVPLNSRYASPHFVLSEVFIMGNYKVPAFLAASRFISLEIRTQRSQRASQVIRHVLQGGVSQGKNSNEINITVDPNAPKDEGDFSGLDLLVGLAKAGGGENKVLTEEEKFADQIETVITFLETDEKIKPSFVGKNYIPFMVEMKRRGFVKPYAYIVLFHAGNPEASKWLNGNSQQAADFLNWAKSY